MMFHSLKLVKKIWKLEQLTIMTTTIEDLQKFSSTYYNYLLGNDVTTASRRAYPPLTLKVIIDY